MKEKTFPFHNEEVHYTEQDWQRLDNLRSEAIPVMETIAMYDPVIYGSVARGDVHSGSDIDIFIPTMVSSFVFEVALEKYGIMEKAIAMATPWHLIKAHIVLSNSVTITFPLVDFKGFEREFYFFGGALRLDQLKEGIRVPGVDKRLMLIEPTPYGHVGSEITDREAEVAKIVGVPFDLVREREKVLSKRDKVGRTGIYLHRHLAPDENIELELKRLADTDSYIRRRYYAT
jgi:hypothetical protein